MTMPNLMYPNPKDRRHPSNQYLSKLLLTNLIAILGAVITITSIWVSHLSQFDTMRQQIELQEAKIDVLETTLFRMEKLLEVQANNLQWIKLSLDEK